MSYYDDEPPRRHRSHRSSRPVYEEEVIEARQTRPKREPEHMELVRRRDSDESVEEVRRDFPPGDGMYIQRRTTTRDRYAPRRHSADRRSYYDDDYDRDPRRSDPAVVRSSRRRYSRRRYDSESEEESRSPPPRKNRERRKSLSEQALAAVGLGGAAASLAKFRNKHEDRSPSRSPSRDDRRGDRSRARSQSRRGRRDDSYSRSRSRTPPRDKSVDRRKKIQQAAKAAATAGVIEAWRARKEPGGFAGQGKRILTAAIGAAGIDGAISGKDPEHHSTRHTIEAALGGLAGNRLINGPREASRSRGREEQGKTGADIGGVASAAGLAALAGKAFNDYRSRSRGRKENSDDERSPERRSRSRSVSEYITRGVDGAMAKLGLGNPKDHDPKTASRRNRRYSSDEDDDYYRARPRGGGAEETHRDKGSSSSDDTDSYSSDNEIKKQKKIRNKALITGGLATVATIHAVANVHGSMEKGKERHKAVAAGKMSPEEARKKKSKALLQDAAAVGIAAIGIKSAVSEWKELKEKREEYGHACTRLEEKREHRRQKLLRSKSSSRSDGDLRRRYSDEEETYYYRDDNPYSAGVMSPPPMGGHSRSGYQ